MNRRQEKKNCNSNKERVIIVKKCVPLCSYKHMVEVRIPGTLKMFYNSPSKESLESIFVDECLSEEIEFLLSIGIKTTGCCCGHGVQSSYIGVQNKHIEQMKKLGYEVVFNPCRPKDEDSFYSKSIKRK